MATLTVVEDEAELAAAAAERITTLIERAIAQYGNAVVSLTGGGTPRRLYSLLGDSAQPWRARIDWPRLHLFWGDERHVPPDHIDSNFGMAQQALLRHVPLLPEHIHRMHGELPEAAAATADYARELDAGFARAGRADRTFDVMLLGLGEDAHIASIFPGSELIAAHASGRPADGGTGDANGRRPDPLAAAVWAAHLDAWRITLTPAALLDSRAIVMVVAGASKADAVQAAIEDPLDVSARPAQLLRQAGDRVEWFADRAAARRLRT